MFKRPLAASGGSGNTPLPSAVGDMLYSADGATWSRLPIGAANEALATSAGIPDWRKLVNADIDAAAAIAVSKLAPGLAGQFLGGVTPAYAYPPGFQLDYAAISVSATSTATTAATAVAAITGASIVYDGTPVRIIFNAPAVLNSLGAPVASAIDIWRDSTDLGQVAIVSGSNALGKTAVMATIIDTPSAGAHVYSIRHWVSSASTSTIQCGAGGAGTLSAAEMRVIKI